MTIIKTYCDHCGKELDSMHDYPDLEISLIGYRKADFCQKCLDELDTIIANFIKNDE